MVVTWINKDDGSLYEGDCRAEDSKMPATQAEIDAWKAKVLAALSDQSNFDILTRRDKAILLAAAAMTGSTPAQVKTAYKTAFDSLA